MSGLSFSINWDCLTLNAHRSSGCELILPSEDGGYFNCNLDQILPHSLIPPSEDGGYFNSNLRRDHPQSLIPSGGVRPHRITAPYEVILRVKGRCTCLV